VRCKWVCHFEPLGDGKGTEPPPPKCNSERLHCTTIIVYTLWINNYDCWIVLVSITDLPCSASLVSHPRRCKTNLVGQSAGLSVSRSPVRFRQKLRTSRTQIYIWVYGALAKLLVYFFRSNKSNINQIDFLLSGIQPWSVVSVTWTGRWSNLSLSQETWDLLFLRLEEIPTRFDSLMKENSEFVLYWRNTESLSSKIVD